MPVTKKLLFFPKATGTSLEIIVQSHLSDAMIEVDSDTKLAKVRIGFAKHLISLYDGDLSQRIDATKHFSQYLEYYKIDF